MLHPAGFCHQAKSSAPTRAANYNIGSQKGRDFHFQQTNFQPEINKTISGKLKTIEQG